MRNLNITAIVMDNGVYGLTKGQSSPTTDLGVITSSTPYGKMEEKTHPLRSYMTMGVSFIASVISNKVKDMSDMMFQAMNHQGFSIVHVQSPCTEYNNTYEALKGSKSKGIDPLAYTIPEGHDPEDAQAAQDLVDADGIPVGIIYKDTSRATFDQKLSQTTGSKSMKTVEDFMGQYSI